MKETENREDSSTLSIAYSEKWRLRPDIEWLAYPDSGRWVAIDPISNSFFYFDAIEYEIVSLMDGKRTGREILRKIRASTLRAIQDGHWFDVFVHKLLRCQLLELPVSSLRTAVLGTAGSERATRRFPWKSALLNPLSIRIPLLRPSIDYGWARVLSSLFFSRIAIVGLLIGLLLTSYGVLASMLANPEQILYDISRIQGDRWLVLAALLVAIKSCHEFGHYLACVRNGVRCAEVGLMLLCFTPCLYCDTTESWRLSSRWQRAGIAAAGVYFEFWIALLGGFLFLNTPPGLLHLLGAGMWVMCTLGTLVVNANPFFRYDGYFVLSDLLCAPNLSHQSNQALWQAYKRVLGSSSRDDESYDYHKGFLIPFAVASSLYRWLVLGGILLFLWHFLVPIGFGLYFILLTGAIGVGAIKSMNRNLQYTLAELDSPNPISPWRLLLLATAMLVVSVAIFFYPVSNRITERGYVEFKSGIPIYSPDLGRLTEIGDWDSRSRKHRILEGELILAIGNHEREFEALSMEHEQQLMLRRIELLEQSRVTDDKLASDVPMMTELASEYGAKLQVLREELTKLRVTAPQEGYFVPKRDWVQTGFQQGEPQRRWEPVISQSTLGKSFKRGELVGWFTGSDAQTAIAFVSRDTIRSISAQTPVEIVCDSHPGKVVRAKVAYYSNDPIQIFPEELVGEPNFVLQRNERGELESEMPLYRVRIECQDDPDALEGTKAWPRGGRCSIRFELPNETLASMAYRVIASQFKSY